MNTPGLVSSSSPHGVTFDVDPVIATLETLPVGTLGESLELRSGCFLRVMPDRYKPVLAPRALGPLVVNPNPPNGEERDSLRAEPAVRRSRGGIMFIHPLLEAVHIAFSEHRPLVLSPDSIWLVIAQGFGHHVRQEHEELRSRLVRHAGQRTLYGAVTALDAANWRSFVAQMSDQIRQATDPVLYEALLCDFSTSSIATRIASEVVLMDTYARYFEYCVMCICGIPQITVRGTVADWGRMRDRVEVLATYGLEWWVSRVRPILDEFVRAASGDPDRDFWRAIYKPERAYGREPATGWIVDLFPYLGDPPRCRVNPVFETSRIDWTVPLSAGVSPSSFPSGLSRVPVSVSALGGPLGTADLIAGFCGVGQELGTNALYPVISWSVTDSTD